MPSPLLMTLWPAQNMSVGTFSSSSAPVVGFQTYALKVPASKTVELFPEPAISRILPPGPMIRWYTVDPEGSDGRRAQLPPDVSARAVRSDALSGSAALVWTGESSVCDLSVGLRLAGFRLGADGSLRIEKLLLIVPRLRFAVLGVGRSCTAKKDGTCDERPYLEREKRRA